jgi:hypothetical protein
LLPIKKWEETMPVPAEVERNISNVMGNDVYIRH